MFGIELNRTQKLKIWQNGITPRFEFGFGLSYTQFEYSNLQVSKVYNSDNTQADSQEAWDAGKPSPSGQGSSAAIWFVEAIHRFCTR